MVPPRGGEQRHVGQLYFSISMRLHHICVTSIAVSQHSPHTTRYSGLNTDSVSYRDVQELHDPAEANIFHL